MPELGTCEDMPAPLMTSKRYFGWEQGCLHTPAHVGGLPCGRAPELGHQPSQAWVATPVHLVSHLGKETPGMHTAIPTV